MKPFLLLSLLLLKIQVRAQNIEEFLNAVIYFTRPADSVTYAGTGFLISEISEDSSYRIYLITNQHTLPDTTARRSIFIRVSLKQEDSSRLVRIEIPIVDVNKHYFKYVQLNKQGKDIAIVDITDYWKRYKLTNQPLDISYFPTDIIVQNAGILPGERIYILGFPSSLYNEKNTYPILREGVVSTPPYESYYFNATMVKKSNFPEILDGFLIDASVFEGSSGSLVFFWPHNTELPKGAMLHFIPGETPKVDYRKMPHILGVLSKALSQRSGNQEKIDIGIVYSYRAILETLNQFK